MKKLSQFIIPAIIVIYLVIGLGIDQYTEFQESQNDTFLEALERENNRLSPGHIWRIVMWPFYL
jgi:hypothetical protein